MKLWSILGNSQKLDGGAMFGNAPKAVWEKWIAPDAENRIPLACRALLVDDLDGKTVLFETGIGAFFEPRLRERYGDAMVRIAVSGAEPRERARIETSPPPTLTLHTGRSRVQQWRTLLWDQAGTPAKLGDDLGTGFDEVLVGRVQHLSDGDFQFVWCRLVERSDRRVPHSLTADRVVNLVRHGLGLGIHSLHDALGNLSQLGSLRADRKSVV